MSSNISELQQLYHDFLLEFYKGVDPKALESIQERIEADSDGLADGFYRQMMQQPGSENFLDNDKVNTRLRASMKGWISDLFRARTGKTIEEYIKVQIEIGRVHARIDLPLHLFSHGIRRLKRDITATLKGAARPCENSKLEVMHELFDIVSTLIIESYLVSLTSSERQGQALKMDSVGRHLVVECERMRAALLDWLRHTLTELHKSNGKASSIRDSEFGLWAVHKAAMLLEDDATSKGLCEDIEIIDQVTRGLFSETATDKKDQSLQDLNTLVTQTSWKLLNISENLSKVETGRDPLTTLFNRRYLDPILKREVRYSIRHHQPFGLLLIDVDYFKRFNDTHGHSAGDAALRVVADVISETVRSSDVVFRYGGEEFLVLLSEMDRASLLAVAEKLRARLAEQSIPVEHSGQTQLTISIGGALHDGHPDYMNTIERADQALYQAKDAGRDRVNII